MGVNSFLPRERKNENGAIREPGHVTKGGRRGDYESLVGSLLSIGGEVLMLAGGVYKSCHRFQVT